MSVETSISRRYFCQEKLAQNSPRSAPKNATKDCRCSAIGRLGWTTFWGRDNKKSMCFTAYSLWSTSRLNATIFEQTATERTKTWEGPDECMVANSENKYFSAFCPLMSFFSLEIRISREDGDSSALLCVSVYERMREEGYHSRD